MRIFSLPFCSSGPCLSPERSPEQDSGHDEVKSVKPKCLGRKKKNMRKIKKQKNKKERRQPQSKRANSKHLALEEWFPKSPSVVKKSNCNNKEYKGLKHRSGSACVSESGEYSTVSLEDLLNSSNYNTSVDTESVCFSESRDFSFSLEKLLKNQRKVEEDEMELNSFSRSQIGKEKKKKVSFRLPEVSDIIILNSPEVDLKHWSVDSFSSFNMNSDQWILKVVKRSVPWGNKL